MFSNRPSLPADFGTLDIATKPLFPVGKKGTRVSAEYLIQRQVCQDALGGKRKAISIVLRYAVAKEAAEVKVREIVIPLSKRDPERRATNAMLLLSVASRAKADGPLMLEPWVPALALSREGAPSSIPSYYAERIEQHTRDPAAPAPGIFILPRAELPARRSPEATQFQKGKSGNPKGRPKKIKHDLPLTNYFDEITTVRVHGKNFRMTRLQFVLHHLHLKAIKGDACTTAVLAGKYLPVQLERHERGDHLHREADLHDKYKLPQRIQSDPFEQMLRHYRITNPRTTTRVLLEPWVVEAALDRFGDRRLTQEEQAEVLRSTSKPGSAAWPEWWVIRTHADARPYRPIKPRFRGTTDYWYETRY